MPTLVIEEQARAQEVEVTEEELRVVLTDGRTIAVPLMWFPRLWHGNAEERQKWVLVGGGEGIHWPALDEDIKVSHLLAGIPSRESQASLRRWLEQRHQRIEKAGKA